jgi:2-oxoglutarate ferredoxin oxidoreductase subunit gamma
MTQNTPSTVELIVAGLGGQGVLFAGEMLARAGMQQYRNVSYMPSYGTEKRGGLSECTVVMSNEPINSPVLDQAQALMLLDSSQVTSFEGRVRPGGTLLTEKSGLEYEPQRTDFRLLSVAGLEIALGMGGAIMNNLIMLGVYTQLIQAVPTEMIMAEIEKKCGDNHELFERNREAFNQGMELGKALAD